MAAMVRVAVLLVLVGVVVPAAAIADVRVSGTCGSGASSELRLKADHGEIRLRFELEGRRTGERWRIVLVHERRVVWRGTRRTRSGRRLRVRRSLHDYAGADSVRAHASGPGGNTCSASATITGR
jgi:hypothetical protein